MRVEKSFLKWAGSKNKIITKLLPHLPKGSRLIEPFVGAGNVFINADYQDYILADLNADLINVYQWLKDEIIHVVNETEALFNSNADYYKIRSQFNKSQDRKSFEQAIRFIYLNRHCFNGLCRYNKSGEFNVPQGKPQSIYFPRRELINFSNKLANNDVQLIAGDYHQALKNARAGDVIYCDPPYLSSIENAFTGYTSLGFSAEDTKTLATTLKNLVTKKGASAVVSNCDNEQTRQIFKDFKIHKISAGRTIAANGDRKKAKEIICVLTPDMV